MRWKCDVRYSLLDRRLGAFFGRTKVVCPIKSPESLLLFHRPATARACENFISGSRWVSRAARPHTTTLHHTNPSAAKKGGEHNDKKSAQMDVRPFRAGAGGDATTMT